MDLKNMVANWTKLGEQDPLWAILTDPEKRDNKWDVKEFFETGTQQVKQDIAWLKELGVEIEYGKALDFGCGVGRLTQALTSCFQEVHGADISPTMIESADRFAEQHKKNIQFFCLHTGTLADFEDNTYDFVCSHISLQHISTAFQKQYIKDLFRILAPKGIALLQTIHTHGWRALVPDKAAEAYRILKHRGKPYIPMYGISPGSVASLAAQGGCRIVKALSSPAAGCENRFLSDTYCVLKKPNLAQ